uniref:Fibroleukin-like isoform X2 n=1 Tax=Crassostrea virginica TaxID=6565 RepID=A0A8B8AVY7_CRAVI|nr:fibroleukin-like isoform X2 [Crassostrea virginica]
MNWKQFTLFMILFGEVIEYSSSSTSSRKNQSLLTDITSKNDLSVLQGILNQESLVRFSMVQKIQNVVMDIVDIRKTEALFTENFKTIISEMRALNAENQQQKEEILEMKKGLANCKEGIKQIRKTQEDKSDDLSSLERHFTSFSFSVNETFNTMWKNQSAQDTKLIEIKENLDTMSKRLTLSTQSIMTLADVNENQSQAISYLKQENKEVDRIIRQFNASLADGAEDSFTFREDYLQLSNTVNKTLENVLENQNIQKFQVMKLKSQSDALTKTLEHVNDGIKKFEVDKENQTKELEELKMNQSGFYTAIRQLNSTLAELSSLKMNYSHFSLAVNETIDDIWRNQSLQDIEMMDIFSNIRAVKDCSDIIKRYSYMSDNDGVYTIHPNKSTKRKVFCDMTTDGGGWTVIQNQVDGSTDFYRTWNEYKEGFGNSSHNYWIGNDVLHLLTKNEPQELRVELQRFSGEKGYAEYSTFAVGDESSKYQLTVSGFEGNIGSALTKHPVASQIWTHNSKRLAYTLTAQKPHTHTHTHTHTCKTLILATQGFSPYSHYTMF